VEHCWRTSRRWNATWRKSNVSPMQIRTFSSFSRGFVHTFGKKKKGTNTKTSFSIGIRC
jgi:hypothetical protein